MVLWIYHSMVVILETVLMSDGWPFLLVTHLHSFSLFVVRFLRFAFSRSESVLFCFNLNQKKIFFAFWTQTNFKNSTLSLLFAKRNPKKVKEKKQKIYAEKNVLHRSFLSLLQINHFRIKFRHFFLHSEHKPALKIANFLFAKKSEKKHKKANHKKR